MQSLSRMPVAILVAFAFLAAPAPALAVEIAGRVVAITDGDTLTVLDGGNRQVKVRLAAIDTPERAQPYGDRAGQVLAALAFGKAVRVEAEDSDRYGRLIGRVRTGAVDVNAEMVRQGAAWVYRQYSRDPALLRLEGEAQAAKRGVWALPEAQRVPPWQWRALARSEPMPTVRPQPAMSVAPSAAPGAGGFSCGAKRYCTEMASCAEARFHHAQCGLSRLDRDGDGVPCEALCRR